MEENENNVNKRISFKESFSVVSQIAKLYYRISPVRTIIFFLGSSLSGLRGFFYALLFAKTIDRIISLAQINSSDFRALLPYLGVLLAYGILFEGILGGIIGYCRRFFRTRYQFELDKLMYQHINTLGIQTLEDPQVTDLIQRSQQWLYDTFDLFIESINLFSQIIRSIVSGIVVISFAPAVVPIFIIFKGLEFIPRRYFNRQNFRWHVDNSESRRRTTNLIWHLSDTRTLPEISVVGGFSFLNKKIIDFHSWYQQGFLKIITKSQISNSIVTIIGDIIILIAYSFVFVTLMLKKITVGIATFQLNAIDNFSGALSNLIGSFSMFSDIAPKMTDLIKLMHLKPAIIDGTTHLPSLQEAPALEFKNVWFKYPNADTYVLKDLDLAIRSKEKIAIVGENGAGKTTIIKLIARLYSIQKGKILINSNNLNDLAINDWYKNISVLFQDFNTYISLSAEENIAMGRPILGIDHDKVIAAAKQADAHKFISQYKHGYEQLLSERYKGGIRPSTGQWQKIALARMFYRDPPLLIFDEPTATIDAISEYRIFNRIYKFFKNKTVIIVSHRFSTVRNADRIIVLSKGRITEQGSHSELMEKNGTYAKMFRLQAKGYQ